MPAESIPVIDIERLSDAGTLAALENACREWGFFQVTNHGLSGTLTENLRRAMRDFFALRTDSKRAILRTRDNPWGYYDQELTKNVRDWKEVFDYGPADGKLIRPQWPEGLAGFEQTIRAWTEACESLAFRLLAAVSENLGMPPGFLADGFGRTHTSFLRLNHYPVCPEPARPDGLERPASGHLGISHHTDAGALTILLQDEQPGLEVFREGDWYLVQPQANALVINIGDIVQVWSNDRYQAALHRVVTDSEHERFSAPYFFNPDYATSYAPLPSLVDDDNPARYRSINWGEFRRRRADGDYADYGAEIQISDYAQ